MGSSVACHFTVTGHEFDPDAFTRSVGLAPTDTWREGDRVGVSEIRRHHTGWRCSVPRRSSLDLSEPLRELLEEILLHSKAIRAECDRLGLEAEVSCVVFVGSPAPAAHFDTDTLNAVRELGASIDLDLYIDADQ